MDAKDGTFMGWMCLRKDGCPKRSATIHWRKITKRRRFEGVEVGGGGENVEGKSAIC